MTVPRELMKGTGHETREEAAPDVFKCSKLHCNTVRMHSALNYNSLVEYERRST